MRLHPVFWIVFFSFACFPGKGMAQIQGQSYVTGGGLSLSMAGEQSKNFQFTTTPFIGKVIWNRWVVGLNPQLSWFSYLDTFGIQRVRATRTQNSGFVFSQLYLSPKDRQLQVFWELKGGFASDKGYRPQIDSLAPFGYVRRFGFQWGTAIGVSYWVNPNVSLNGSLNVLSGVKELDQGAIIGGFWSVAYWFGKRKIPIK